MIKFSYFNLILLIYIPQPMHNGQGKEKMTFGTKFFLLQSWVKSIFFESQKSTFYFLPRYEK